MVLGWTLGGFGGEVVRYDRPASPDNAMNTPCSPSPFYSSYASISRSLLIGQWDRRAGSWVDIGWASTEVMGRGDRQQQQVGARTDATGRYNEGLPV